VHRDVLGVGPASGGVCHSFTTAMRHVAARGWQVTVEQADERASAAGDALRAVWRRRRLLRAADAVHIEFGSNDRAAFWFAVFAVLIRRDCTVFAHDHPRLVHTPAAGLVALTSRSRVILAYRVLGPLLDRPLVALVMRRAGSVVVMSEAARKACSQRVSGPIIVVPHVHELPVTDASPPSAGAYVLFAGFLGPGKGIDLLVDAWREIASQTSVSLLIAGGACDEAWVRSVRERARDIRPPIRWLGPIFDERDFQRLFAHAAVVVLPYRASNPASGILVRAMTQGRCVVASRVPAVVAATRDGRDALHVDPGDVRGLIAALRQALDSPAHRDRLGAAAAARARELFSAKEHAAGLERAYEAAACRR
jgi:glycosyltransferase involved in cell wall biosynthesis